MPEYEDEEFWKLAVRFEERKGTYLDVHRLWTLWKACEAIAPMDLPVAEVGVWAGGSSLFMARAMEHFGHRPELYLFDTFCGHMHVDPEHDAYHRVGMFKADIHHAIGLLHDYQLHIYQGMVEDTTARINGEKFGLLHLDCDLYRPTKHSIEFFWPRIAPGGKIVVDDYGSNSARGVKEAVQEVLPADAIFTANGHQQAILEKPHVG
jgi:O-methyltransferase